jgi:rod shape-determining protein MreD
MSIKAGVMPGVYVGFFLGLGQDLFSPNLLGQNALAMSITGFVCGLFNERVMRLDPILRTVLLIGAFIVNDTVVMLVHVLKTNGEMSTILMELLVSTLPRAIYTLFFAAVPFVWTHFIRPPRLTSGSS